MSFSGISFDLVCDTVYRFPPSQYSIIMNSCLLLAPMSFLVRPRSADAINASRHDTMHVWRSERRTRASSLASSRSCLQYSRRVTDKSRKQRESSAVCEFPTQSPFSPPPSSMRSNVNCCPHGPRHHHFYMDSLYCPLLCTNARNDVPIHVMQVDHFHREGLRLQQREVHGAKAAFTDNLLHAEIFRRRLRAGFTVCPRHLLVMARR